MDLYKFTIVMIKLQGIMIIFHLIFNLGYAYQELYALFHYDSYQVYSQYRIMSSWMYIVRQILDIMAIFIFFRYAHIIAALLVSGVRKIERATSDIESKNSD